MLAHSSYIRRWYTNPDTLPVCKCKFRFQSLRELTNRPKAHGYFERIRFCIARPPANRLAPLQMQQVPHELPATKPSENADGNMPARADEPYQRSAHRIE